MTHRMTASGEMMRIKSSTFYSENENDRFLCKRYLRRSQLEDLHCYDRQITVRLVWQVLLKI